MSELPIVNYDSLPATEIDLDTLLPKEGQIKLDEHRPPVDAFYLEDSDGSIIGYITHQTWFGNPNEKVIESFTNSTFRKKGLQKKLNDYMIRSFRERGVEKIVGRIMVDNSKSLLNRLQMKDPETGMVLAAEIDNLDELEARDTVDPHELWVNINLNETVKSNENLLHRLDAIQHKLTKNRYNYPLIRKRDE